MKILDIGCGGGLLSEPMCRLGASVVGIDAAKKILKLQSFMQKKINLRLITELHRLKC